MKRVSMLVAAMLMSLHMAGAGAEEASMQVNVVGLYSGKAVIIVDHGKPQTLAVGDTTREGVKLLAADSASAQLLIAGKRRQLGMGQAAIVAGKSAGDSGSAILYADAAGHHLTEGYINSARMKFLVDTGASAIAMNAADASRAGIDYKRGQRIPVHTANGDVSAYRVVINSLRLGGLTLNQVDAMVLDGTSPEVVLLGMTALSRMDMKREGIVLTLTKRY